MHPFSMEVKKCPYPHYDTWRDENPVLWNEEMGAWLVLGYKEAVYVLEHDQLFSSTNSVFTPEAQGVDTFPSIINTDEPRHSKLRALVARGFTPKSIKREWVDRIQRIVQEQLDGIEGDTFKVVGDLAYPLPVRMIAEIIGVEPERFAQFKQWSDTIAKRIGLPAVTPEEDAEFQAAVYGLSGYFFEQMEDRKNNPRDDIVTRLMEAEVDGQKLTIPELQSFLMLLLVAGNETTTNLIAAALRVLSADPEMMRRVSEDRSLVAKLIEESLRWDAPIQGFYRKATQDVEVAGKRIKKGDPLCVLYGAANHDPDRYGEPGLVRLERASREHLAFGRGIHFCLGANLARIEADSAINGVLDRFETLRPVEGYEIEWRRTPFFRGPVEYPVYYTLRGSEKAATV